MSVSMVYLKSSFPLFFFFFFETVFWSSFRLTEKLRKEYRPHRHTGIPCYEHSLPKWNISFHLMILYWHIITPNPTLHQGSVLVVCIFCVWTNVLYVSLIKVCRIFWLKSFVFHLFIPSSPSTLATLSFPSLSGFASFKILYGWNARCSLFRFTSFT